MATEILGDVIPFTRPYKKSRPSRSKLATSCPVMQLHSPYTPKEQIVSQQLTELLTGNRRKDGSLVSKKEATLLTRKMIYRIREIKRTMTY